MKCGRCNTIYIGRTGKFWCETCEASAICGKPDPEHADIRCLREPEHKSACSPMHFRVFSEVEIERYNFDRWDHRRGRPR